MHEIITHNQLPMELQNALDNKKQLEDEADNESTARNFKIVVREGDLSPRLYAKQGKKGNKQNQLKEQLPPTRILPKRAAPRVDDD